MKKKRSKYTPKRVPSLRKRQKIHDNKVIKKFGFTTRIDPYINLDTKIKYGCGKSGCNNTFMCTPATMQRKVNNFCVECSFRQMGERNRLKKEDFFAKLEDAFNGDVVCTHYEASDRKASFLCNRCGHTYESRANQVITSMFGCKQCAVDYTQKNKKLRRKKLVRREDGSLMYVEGYEKEVYLYLKTLKGVKEKDIFATKSGKVPVIQYKEKRKNRSYYPDFFIKSTNTIVEVKSKWTAGMALDNLKYKAKAVIKAGFKFQLIIVDNKIVIPISNKFLEHDTDYIYEKIQRKKCGKRIVYLGLDPGTQNFAWSVLSKSGRVKNTGMLSSTIKDLKGGVKESMETFVHDIQFLCDHYKVTHIGIERFMTRGNKGVTIELINQMIGGLIHYVTSNRKGTHIKLITAAQWKNNVNKNQSLEAIYKLANKTLTVHQIDSIGIASYIADLYTDENLTSKLEKAVKKFLANKGDI